MRNRKCLPGLLCALALLLSLPAPTLAAELPAPSTLARGVNGEVWAVTSRGDLIQMDDGGPAAYLLRHRVMGDVQSVTSQGGAVAAIDREGRLWGWRSGGVRCSVLAKKLPEEPTVLAQSVRQAAVGDSYIAAVTRDDELLLLDSAGKAAPGMEEREIGLCRVAGGQLYAVTTDGVLYQLDGGTERKIAAGVADVNVAQGMTAQCRMEDGTVRLLADGSLGGPVYDKAAAVCVNALVSEDGALLVWHPDATGGLALQRQETHVAAAFSDTLYLRTDGRLCWEGMAFHASLRTLDPLFQNLFCAGVAVGILALVLFCRRRRNSTRKGGST